MQQTNVLVVVNSEEARTAYEQALCQLGAAYEVASSFQQAQRICVEKSFNGVMIDILTLVRCDKDEKLIAYDCINLYPSIRVKWDGRTKRINLSLLEQTFASDPEAALRFFLENRCRNFPARSLRKHHRTPICLALILCAEEPGSVEEGIKTFTVNLSPGGAFVHTVHPFHKGEKVWLTFAEFADPTPIRGEVRWSVAWGAGRTIPGIGIAFESLTDSQAAEITELTRM